MSTRPSVVELHVEFEIVKSMLNRAYKYVGSGYQISVPEATTGTNPDYLEQSQLFWGEQQLRAQFLSVFLFSVSSDSSFGSRIKFMAQLNTFWDISQQDSSSISV
ncbi:hypothetical protein C8R44DRAFT_725432 [Mycena epipterygia]|nr:hypothetical protein C8R44DRAFT_725432 [Mycena epipterygia]